MDLHQKKIELFGKYAEAIRHNGEFYIGDDIPPKIIDNAEKKFAKGLDRNTVVGLIDTSILSSGKCGYVFTDEELFYLQSLERPKRLRYSDIKSVESSHIKKKDSDEFFYVTFNDGSVEKWIDSFLNKTPLERFFNELLDLIRGAGANDAPDGETVSPPKFTPESAQPAVTEDHSAVTVGNGALQNVDAPRRTPPTPYEGNGSYIFVSYAHKDDDAAWAFIGEMQKAGFRVWFDRGVDSSVEQDLRIARMLENCGCFIALITSSYIASQNCLADLDRVGDLGKDQIAVYLEDVRLTRELAMRLYRLRTVRKNAFDSERTFYETLFFAENIERYRSGCETVSDGKLSGNVGTETDPGPNGEASETETSVSAAPVPYKGGESYIFVSYAHKDDAQVWEIISKMQKAGFRVWFDRGIDPGTEWDEYIARMVRGCGYFIAFLSENYLASDNCKDELNFARDLNKDRLLVYLEEVALPDGMAMRLNRLQAIFRNRYENEKEFYDTLYAAKNIGQFRSDRD